MRTIETLNSRISESVIRELKVTSDKIRQNMTDNNQVASGETLKSIHEDFANSTGIIWGADHIDTLETGISPERSKVNSWVETFNGIDKWQRVRGFGWVNKQIGGAVKKQRIEGSLMYRSGMTKQVYSHEAEPLAKRIADSVGLEIVETKIL